MMDDLLLFRLSQLLGTLCLRSKTGDKQAFVHTPMIVLVFTLPLVFAVVMMAGDYRPQTASS